MTERSFADQKSFITLIRAAQEDAALRERLLAILQQPGFHRKSLLNTLIAELSVQSAPAELVQAVACLLNDDVAEKARELLNEPGVAG